MIDSLLTELQLTKDPIAKGSLYLKVGSAIQRWNLNKYESYIDSALALKTFSILDSNKIKIDYQRANLFKKQNKYLESETLFKSILADSSKHYVSPSLVAQSYFHLGDLAKDRNRMEEAIHYYLESIDIFQREENEDSKAVVNNAIGVCYTEMDQHDYAVKYYEKSLKAFKKSNRHDGVAICNMNIGLSSLALENYNAAKISCEEALKISKQHPIGKNYLGSIYSCLGEVSRYDEKHEKALAHFQKVEEVWFNNAAPSQTIHNKYNIAQTLIELKQYDKAKKLISQGIRFFRANELESGKYLKNLYECKFKVHRLVSEHRQAYEALDSLQKYNRLSHNEELEKHAMDLVAKYEANSIERENEFLAKEALLNDEKIKSIKFRNIILSVGLIPISMLIFWLYKLLKKSKIQNKITQQALSEREILLKEIHHRVKNNLQLIGSLLGLQSEHVQDKHALDALLEGQDRVQSMALIHQNLYQEEHLMGVDVKAYFIKLMQSLFDSYNVQENEIELSINIQDLILDIDSIIPIGLVVNELISNCLKHAFPKKKGHIILSLYEIESQLHLTVKDNGIGIREQNIENFNESFGLRLVNVFKDQLKAELMVNGHQGTEVKMIIKKYKKAT